MHIAILIIQIINYQNYFIMNTNVSKLEQRESAKSLVRVAKANEVSLSSRTKNLLKVATETQTGKEYLSLHGFTVDDAKNIFTVPTVLGMYSSLSIHTKELKEFQDFFKFAKYNKERDNGTFLSNDLTIESIKTKISILDIKRFRLSTFDSMYVDSGKVFIRDNKDTLYVAEQIETISIFHIVQKINSYRNEVQRIASVEQRKKDFEQKKLSKEQSTKDKEKSAKETKSNKVKK